MATLIEVMMLFILSTLGLTAMATDPADDTLATWCFHCGDGVDRLDAGIAASAGTYTDGQKPPVVSDMADPLPFCISLQLLVQHRHVPRLDRFGRSSLQLVSLAAELELSDLATPLTVLASGWDGGNIALSVVPFWDSHGCGEFGPPLEFNDYFTNGTRCYYGFMGPIDA